MTNQSATSFSILIAGISDRDSLAIKTLLEKDFHAISLASEYSQALDLLQHAKYRLIFWAFNLASDYGLNTIHNILQQTSPNLNTPVVALIDHAVNHLTTKLLMSGFDACLTMPVRSEQLNELVNYWRFDAINPENIRCDADDYIEQLLQKAGNNTDLAIILFEKLFTEIPVQMQTLQRALNESEFTQALQVAHKLHGSILFCGFKALQPAAMRLEQNLRRKKDESSLIMFQILQHKIAQFLRMKVPIMQKLTEY